MTDSQLVADHRYRAIKLYESGESVAKVCALFGRSRTWFYKWLNRYRSLGIAGLHNQIREVCPANRTPIDMEGKVLDFAIKFPSYGPQRIADMLAKQGIIVGRTAVHGVLKRNHLNRRKQRLEKVRILSGEIVTPSELDTARQLAKTRHIKASCPGALVCIDTFYIGCIKGIGRIYQMTGIDAATSFGWAKIYTDKTAAAATQFLDHVLGNANGVNVTKILTDNGLEFTTHWASKNHAFERALKTNNLEHRYTKVRHPWTNGFTERLNRTINEEFYQVAFRKTPYLSVQQLQDDLDRFIHFYNYERTHQGYRLLGKCPSQLFSNPLLNIAV